MESLRPETAGASSATSATSTSNSGVRFRIVGRAAATADPTAFTRTTYVVPSNRRATITDVVLQNPRGDSGMMQILIGDELILEENLSGLRDQQFAIPLRVNPGQPVAVAVNCTLPGPPEPSTGYCAPAASFFG